MKQPVYMDRTSLSPLHLNPVFWWYGLHNDTQNGLGFQIKHAYIHILHFCFPVVENRKLY